MFAWEAVSSSDSVPDAMSISGGHVMEQSTTGDPDYEDGLIAKSVFQQGRCDEWTANYTSYKAEGVEVRQTKHVLDVQ